MAQLKNDCFAFGGEMMAVSDAWALLREKIQTVAGVEAVALDDALGRTLARDVVSNRAVPPHDNSAVDGYAVHYSALNADGDTRLKVTGRVAAGHPLGRAAGLDEAIRIFTGAPMPDGPDTVFMDEDATVDGDAVILPAGLKKGANLGRADGIARAHTAARSRVFHRRRDPRSRRRGRRRLRL